MNAGIGTAGNVPGPKSIHGRAPPGGQAVRRALIADDDQGFARLLGQMLNESGVGVECVTTGLEGLDLLGRHPFDVVFVSIRLPGLDGMAFLRHLGTEVQRQRVVVTSGAATVREIVECHRLGAFDFLLKPFEKAELAGVLSRVQAAGPPGATPAPNPVAAPTASAPVVADEPPDTWIRTQILQFIETDNPDLPVPPAVMQRLAALHASADPPAEEVASIIRSSAPLAAMVLRLSHAADVSRASAPPRNIEEALIRLGTTRALTDVVSMASRALARALLKKYSGLVQELWVNHLLSARIAELLAKATVPDLAAHMHPLVMFMEVGELVVLRALDAVHPEALRGDTAADVVRPWVEDLHGVAGSKVLTRWNMPKTYADLALSHADTVQVVGGQSATRGQKVAIIIRAARELAGKLLNRPSPSAPHKLHPSERRAFPQLDQALLDKVGTAALADIRHMLRLAGAETA